MKLILHIGHPKTGTTSLQGFFVQQRVALLRLGILYPWTVHGRDYHTLLPAGFVRDGAVEPSPHGVYFDDYAAFKAGFRIFWRQLKNDIARYKPQVVILSAEQLFKDFEPLSGRSFADLLGEISADVEVVAYIRHPVEDAKSRVAQRIKRGRLIPTLHRPIRAALEYYESLYPGRVRPNVFDPEALHNGDIVEDFVSKYLPQAAPLLGIPRPRKNESLPAALLFVLEQIRQQYQANAVDRASAESFLQIQAANKAFHQLGLHKEFNQKLELRSDLSAYVLRHAGDFLWLKEQYGLRFPRLDYAAIQQSAPSDGKVWTLSEVAEKPALDFASIRRQIEKKRTRSQLFLHAHHSLQRFAIRLREALLRRKQQGMLNRAA